MTDLEGFKKLVDEYSFEYEDYYTKYLNGITYEFSTSSENFEEKVDYLMRKPVKFGRWVIYKCGTCESHDPETPWHVEIETVINSEELHAITSKLHIEHMRMKQHTDAILKEIKGKEYYPVGTLGRFINLFESLVEDPHQYEEYVSATLISDNSNEMVKWCENSKWYKECAQTLLDIMTPDQPQVKFSSSIDVTIEEDGSNRWNMFSDMNHGCVAYVHLTEFTQKVGKRFRITIGELEERK